MPMPNGISATTMIISAKKPPNIVAKPPCLRSGRGYLVYHRIRHSGIVERVYLLQMGAVFRPLLLILLTGLLVGGIARQRESQRERHKQRADYARRTSSVSEYALFATMLYL